MLKNILGFISGNWTSLFGGGLILLTLVGTLYLSVARYNADIREGERVKMRNQQLEQVLKDNQAIAHKIDLLSQDNQNILIELKKKNDKVIETHETVTKYIASPEAQKSDREASPVLKETIRILRDGK